MLHELTGRILGLSEDYTTGKALMTIEINEKSTAKAVFNELREAKKLSFSIKKYFAKRSLNANRYAWHLMNEIGNVLRQDKEEVYLDMLRRYGQRDEIIMYADIPPSRYFEYYDEIGTGILNGMDAKHYIVYSGSSKYNTREMSIFLDGIINDAKELGIPTETPEQIAELKSLWREYEKTNKSA